MLYISSAHAVLSQPVVDVAADIYPGEVYHIGVVTSNNGKIAKLYYENEKKEVTFYDIDGIKDGATILKRDSHDVVILKADFNHESNTAAVSFKYLFNGIFGTYRSAEALLKMNPNTQRYELYDQEGIRPLTSAYVVARYIRNRVIGISTIELK